MECSTPFLQNRNRLIDTTRLLARQQLDHGFDGANGLLDGVAIVRFGFLPRRASAVSMCSATPSNPDRRVAASSISEISTTEVMGASRSLTARYPDISRSRK